MNVLATALFCISFFILLLSFVDGTITWCYSRFNKGGGRENYYAFAQFLIRESIIIIEEISERVKYCDRAKASAEGS